jgi:hypothetical protein
MITLMTFVHRIIIIVLFTLAHFGLTMLAIFHGFIIFRNPSSPWEIFWASAMVVLLFPSVLLNGIVLNTWSQTILMLLNSLLWGTALTFLFLWWRKSRTGQALGPGFFGRSSMKFDNPRRILTFFTLLYFGAAFFIPVYTPFLQDLYFSSFSGEQALVIRVSLTAMAVLSSFLLWIFCRLWMRRTSRGLAAVVIVGLLLPAVILEVPRELSRFQSHRAQVLEARIKTESRLVTMEDEELLSVSGHPVGVRLRYQVHYPEGGEIIAHIPYATVSTAPSPYLRGFTVWKTGLQALNTTDYAITVDLLPDFMPRVIVFPEYAKEPESFCFKWTLSAPGPWGDASRAAVLDSPPQTFRIDLQTPHYSAPTHGTYHLRRFYDNAHQEGARECP